MQASDGVVEREGPERKMDMSMTGGDVVDVDHPSVRAVCHLHLCLCLYLYLDPGPCLCLCLHKDPAGTSKIESAEVAGEEDTYMADWAEKNEKYSLLPFQTLQRPSPSSLVRSPGARVAFPEAV